MPKGLKYALGVVLFCVMCIPFAGVNAATGVANEAELTAALEAGGDIELTSSITVTNPLIVSKDVTIKGNGNTLTSTIAAGGGNRTIISALNSATLTLENITLKDSPKYGVQAYEGGKVVLDGVTIQNCSFGAVLINGGTVTVKDLTLEDNKAGIEFGKGLNVTGEPALVMDGTIDTTKQDDALYIDNAQVDKFVVENTSTTVNKVVLVGDVVAINDADGKQVAASNTLNEGTTVEVDGTEHVAAPIPVDKPTTDTPKKDEVKNPETADGIALYIALAICGLGALAVGSRKLAKQA